MCKPWEKGRNNNTENNSVNLATKVHLSHSIISNSQHETISSSGKYYG